jgi:hypothetical protein
MSTPKSILDQMAKIQRMERGKLCPMQGGRFFNHQSWEKGRNAVRYVPATDVPALRKSIEGYKQFMDLAQNYVDLIVQQTRKKTQKSKTGTKMARK